MSRWFRHYAGMVRDDKLVSAAVRAKQPVERVIWVYGAILESAAEINEGGKYAFDPAEVAYFLRADEADIRNIVSALEAVGRLSEGCVVKWGDRQFQSDRSAERQKRYRDGRKTESDGVRDDSDADVTSLSRHGDAPETETDTKKEKKKDIRAVAVAPRPDVKSAFDEFWKEYPRRDGANPKAPSFKKFRTAIASGVDPAVIVAGAKRYCAEMRAKGQEKSPYVAQAMTWLGQQRWGDYGEPDAIGSQLADPELYLMRDTPGFDAWDTHMRRTTGKGLITGRGGGWLAPALWPPDYAPAENNAPASPAINLRAM